MFTRQHYDFIARAIRELRTAEARAEIAVVLARRFEQDNAGFKPALFMKMASAHTAGGTPVASKSKGEA